MEKIGRGQAIPSVMRKEKKKKAKNELDRLKQAEKKRRRLEKALATSAAIRTELEKKKQKKKEEQQRLDEEGAAIAESVALHVLGGEDSDSTDQIMLDSGRSFNFLGRPESIELCMDYQRLKRYSFEQFGLVSDACGSEFKWNDRGFGWPLLAEMHTRHHPQVSFVEAVDQDSELWPGLIAAQAVSALQIVESSHDNSVPISGSRTARVVFDRMIGGNYVGNEINF